MAANYNYRDNLNLGIGIGSHFCNEPLKNRRHYNITLENNLQFGKQTRYNMKPWIFGQQFMYWIQASDTNTAKILSVSPTIGVLISISKNLGISCEVGPAFNLVVKTEREPATPETGWMWPVLYNWRVQMIYLIKK